MDPILNWIGEFGAAQQRHFVLVSTAGNLSAAFCCLSMVFANRQATWRLAGSSLDSVGLPPCDQDFELVDTTHSVRGELGLVCDDAHLAGMLDSLFFVGFGVGAFCFGRLADTMGRKPAYFFGHALTACSTLSCAAVSSVWLYALLRSVTGVGVGGLAVTTFVLASESIGPSWQALTGAVQSATYSVGGSILALLAWKVQEWRHLTIVTAVLPALSMLLYWSIDESPRWLLAKGKTEEAIQVLQKMASLNSKELIPPELLSALRQVCPKSTTAAGDSSSDDGLAVLLGAILRCRVFVLLFLWCVNAMVYYGLALNAGKLAGSLYVNFAVCSLSDLPSKVVGVILVDLPSVGRRNFISCAMVLAGIACGVCVLTDDSTVVTVAAMIGKSGVAASFALTYVYTAELLPTVVRTGGMGLVSMFARVGGVLAPMIVMLPGDLPFLLFAVASFVAGLVILALPETLGLPLPETVEDCKNDDLATYQTVNTVENAFESSFIIDDVEYGDLEDELEDFHEL